MSDVTLNDLPYTRQELVEHYNKWSDISSYEEGSRGTLDVLTVFRMGKKLLNDPRYDDLTAIFRTVEYWSSDMDKTWHVAGYHNVMVRMWNAFHPDRRPMSEVKDF